MSITPYQEYACPYCGAINNETVDITGESFQRFVTDCAICCRPIVIRLTIENGQISEFFASAENE